MGEKRVIYRKVTDIIGVSNILDKWEKNHPEYRHEIIITEEGYYIELYRDATKESKGNNK